MKKVEIIENILIFISIFSIWPVIFNWPGKGYRFIMLFFLIVLVGVLVNRGKRFQRLLRKLREEMRNEYEKFTK
ncbi:MAG: hypothetical protein GXO71_00770 [Caldiserica bacterium]|nr:hypothetical protein [Caldisericota bacterium]